MAQASAVAAADRILADANAAINAIQGIDNKDATLLQSITALQKATADLNVLFKDQANQVNDLNTQNALLQGNAQSLDSVDEIQTFFNNSQATSFEGRRNALSQAVKQQILNKKMDRSRLKPTTLSHELLYWRTVGEAQGGVRPDQSVMADLKALAGIPTFSGGDDAVWREFELPWLMAVRNRNISEQDLKTVLSQRLQGNAKQYYMSIPGVLAKSFGETMEALKKRYANDFIKSQALVEGATQGPQQKVEDFAASVLVKGRGMLPEEPSELKILTIPNSEVEYVIPNPILEEEEAAYRTKYTHARNQLTRFLYRGLRTSTQARLTSEKYTDFDTLLENAVKAEWMKDSGTGGLVHHLQTEEQTELQNLKQRVEQLSLHALNNKPFKPWSSFRGNRGKPGRATSGQQRDSTCFECGSLDHWVSECPNRKKNNDQQRKAQHYGLQRKTARGSIRGSHARRPTFQKQEDKRPGRYFRSMSSKDPSKRRWMISRRVRSVKKQRRLYHLGTEATQEVSEDEQDLNDFEDQLFAEDPQEWQVYCQQVQEAEEMEEEPDEETKN